MNGWDRELRAFMCYARANDKGDLTQLRENLSSEVEQYIGEEFHIFKDTEDIKWGEDWEKRIEESLSEVIFFIPIITPSFFRSKYCRGELRRFLDREKKLGRNDLILPIYYIETSLLENRAEREIADQDDDALRDVKTLAKIIRDRQHVDWRKLRLKCRSAFGSEEVLKALEGLAIQIRDALDRHPPIIIEPPFLEQTKQKNPTNPKFKIPTIKTPNTTSKQKASTEEIVIDQRFVKQPKPKNPQSLEIKTPRTTSKPNASPTEIVVDQINGGYATISEAIRAANPGDKILVRPGLYQEGLVVDKPLEIVGDGKRNTIKVHAFRKNALVFNASHGRVANLTLRQIGSNGNWHGVDIVQGKLTLENCDISSQTGACVAIHSGADPFLRHNKIRDGKKVGIYVFDNGRGIIEENEIFRNAYSGVRIETGGNPILRRNKIHDGKTSGVFVNKNSQGTLEENDIFGNVFPGVNIRDGGNPTLRRNKIHNCMGSGVFVSENGRGTLEENDIFENGFSGVEIKGGGTIYFSSDEVGGWIPPPKSFLNLLR